MHRASPSTSTISKTVKLWRVVKRCGAVRVLLGVMGLIVLRAQVPYEYFEIAFIEPALVSSVVSEGQALARGYGLDGDTGLGGALSLYDAFDPSVGSHQRQAVFETVVFEMGQLSVSAMTSAFCEPWPEGKEAISGPTVQRRGRYEFESRGQALHHLPSDSPEMRIRDLTVLRLGGRGYERLPRPELRRCRGDLYAIAIDVPGRYRIDYRSESPADALPPRDADFFEGQTSGLSRLDAETEARLLPVIAGHRELRRIQALGAPLPALIRYFQAFESLPLSRKSGDEQALLRTILDEQRGLCRHRSLAFAAIARAWGFDVRIVANEVHAFVEILQDGRYYPVELGGRAESLDLYSPFFGERKIEDFDFLSPSDAPPISPEPNVERLRKTADLSALEVGDALKYGRDFGSERVSEASVGAPRQRVELRRVNDFARLADWSFFLLERAPSVRIVRDRYRVLSGRLVDFALRPLRGLRAELVLRASDGRRLSLAFAQSGADGGLRFELRLPPNTPLGAAELELWIGEQRVIF